MKIFEKLIVVFVFIVIQTLNTPLWAIDFPSIQGKYECNFQGAVHDYQRVIETAKELSTELRCTFHIGSKQHNQGTDSNIDDALYEWIDLEDDKDSSLSKKTSKEINYPLKKTTGIYPTNVTTCKSPVFLLDSSFLL